MTGEVAQDAAGPVRPVGTGFGGPTVGVCAPVYNEGASISNTVREWRDVLGRRGEPFEIVLCDDASTDNTSAALQSCDCQELVVVRHDVNRGAGAAMRTAIRASRAEWLILIDSDGQFVLDDGVRILDRVQESGALTGIGVRQRQDRFILAWGSRLTSWLANRVYGSNLGDFNCALRVVRGDECRAMWLRATTLNYGMDISSRSLLMGLPIVELPVTHRVREAGKSSARVFRDGWRRIRFIRFLRAEAKLVKSGIIDTGQDGADPERGKGTLAPSRPNETLTS